jgi:hypothetical protein
MYVRCGDPVSFRSALPTPPFSNMVLARCVTAVAWRIRIAQAFAGVVPMTSLVVTSVISWIDSQQQGRESSARLLTIRFSTIIDDVTHLASMVRRRGGVLPFDCNDSAQKLNEAVQHAVEVLGFSIVQNAGSIKNAVVRVPCGASLSHEFRLEMASIRSQMVHVLFPCLDELCAWFGVGQGIGHLVRDVLRNCYHYEMPGQGTTPHLLAPPGDAASAPQQKRMIISVMLPVLDMYSAVASFLLDVFESDIGNDEIDTKRLARQVQRCLACRINEGSRAPSLREPTSDVLALDSLETAINWCFQHWRRLPEIVHKLEVAQERCFYSESNAPVTRAAIARGCYNSNAVLPFAGVISSFIGKGSDIGV